MSSVVPGLSIIFGGSRVFGVSSSLVTLLMELMARSISVIASGEVTCMYVVTSMALGS